MEMLYGLEGWAKDNTLLSGLMIAIVGGGVIAMFTLLITRDRYGVPTLNEKL